MENEPVLSMTIDARLRRMFGKGIVDDDDAANTDGLVDWTDSREDGKAGDGSSNSSATNALSSPASSGTTSAVLDRSGRHEALRLCFREKNDCTLVDEIVCCASRCKCFVENEKFNNKKKRKIRTNPVHKIIVPSQDPDQTINDLIWFFSYLKMNH